MKSKPFSNPILVQQAFIPSISLLKPHILISYERFTQLRTINESFASVANLILQPLEFAILTLCSTSESFIIISII